MLSILHREMRLVSKRRWTFYSRVATTVLGFLISLILIFIGPGQSGAVVFNSLTFLSFFFCLIQGVRRAAGTITEEKREGTLGLLFLTPLKPRDIIAGKLFSVAIPLIQPLIAFLPVLSVSILLGGTTQGEFFRAMLVLGSVLFFSVSAGLFISSWSRDTHHSGLSTLFLVLAAVIIPAIFGNFFPPVRYLTPWTAYRTISDPGYRVTPEEFWIPLAATVFIIILALLGAVFFLPRRWDDRETVLNPSKKSRADRRFTPSERIAIMERNPGEWLAVRHSIGRFEIIATNAVMIFFGIVAIALSSESASVTLLGASLPVGLGSFYLLLRLASQASYPLNEARRSGAIDLLIATPLNPSCLIKGQMRTLMRQFIPPFSILFGAGLVAHAVSAFGAARNLAMLPMFLYAVLSIIAVAAAVGAMGMWMGLLAKTPNSAFFRTILWALIIPLFFGGCAPMPMSHLAVLAIAANQIVGRNLARLLRNEKAETRALFPPVIPTPAAPPVIPPPVSRG